MPQNIFFVSKSVRAPKVVGGDVGCADLFVEVNERASTAKIGPSKLPDHLQSTIIPAKDPSSETSHSRYRNFIIQHGSLRIQTSPTLGENSIWRFVPLPDTSDPRTEILMNRTR